MCRFTHKPPVLAKGSEKVKEIEKVDLISIKETIDMLDNDKKVLCSSLLNELIFMQKALTDLKKEVEDNGVVVEMCQGKYNIERANPALNQYNTLIKNYSSCMKQLNELLPEAKNDDDDFEDDDLCS